MPTFEFPSLEDIVAINWDQIEQFGGSRFTEDNLIHREKLEWVLAAIRGAQSGYDPYPTIVEKATVLAWTIINGHVFYDGCKRTGMDTLQYFLGSNGYTLKVSSDDEIIRTAVAIADTVSSGFTAEQFQQWIRERLGKVSS